MGALMDNRDNNSTFSKSYSVLNLMPGKQIGEVIEKQGGNIGLMQILQYEIIPTLKAYKEQVADYKIVHRDVNPQNIIIDVGHAPYSGNKGKNTTVNFIDYDSYKTIGENEGNSFGKPGYLAPEVRENPNMSAQTARDTFSLGMLCVGL